eukprot:scaffold85_cov175-Ochromonas_danica.AAC.26
MHQVGSNLPDLQFSQRVRGASRLAMQAISLEKKINKNHAFLVNAMLKSTNSLHQRKMDASISLIIQSRS